MLLTAALVAAALACAAPQGPADDDIIIIIEDEEPAVGAGVSRSDDDIIVVEEEGGSAPAEDPHATGALGRLWETWHFAADSQLSGMLQLTDAADGPWRLLGDVSFETWILPAPALQLYANGFGRLALDGAPSAVRLQPFADIYEAYAKLSLSAGSVHLGRIVVPWGRTQVAALGDRVNAPDLRRGPSFPDAGRQVQPAWGAWVRTSLGAVAVQGVAIVAYEPPKGSLAASNQGGTRPGRYQLAIVRSPVIDDVLLDVEDAAKLDDEYRLAESAVLGFHAKRRLGDLDLGGSFLWGFDDTPTLHVSKDVARFLARDALLAMGVDAADLPTSPCDTFVEGRADAACVGGPGSVVHGRSALVTADASWGLGIVILKAEVLAHPALFGLPGKGTLLVHPETGLSSARLGHYGAALAVEGAFGDWFQGSVEMFDLWWNDVPPGERLYGVESLDSDASTLRTVHRLAVGAGLAGALWQDRVRWRVRGEGGILQPDVLMTAEMRYRLPVLNLYVGGRTDLFGGVAGSPGWMREKGSLIGVFVGEGA